MLTMLLFKYPPDLGLLLTSHEPDMVSRAERRLVTKSYRLKRQEEASQILSPPHYHHFLFHQSATARRCFLFASVEQGINIPRPSKPNGWTVFHSQNGISRCRCLGINQVIDSPEPGYPIFSEPSEKGDSINTYHSLS